MVPGICEWSCGVSIPVICKGIHRKSNHSSYCIPVHLCVFLPFLQKGTTFVTSCFISCTMQPFQYRVYSERKEFALKGANSFLKELTPNEMGGKNENKEVASPESVPIHLS